MKIKTLFPVIKLYVLPLLFISFFIYQDVSLSHLHFEVRKLVRENKTLIKNLEELRLKVVKNSSPERIEKLYRMQYGYLPVSTRLRIKTLNLPPLLSSSAREEKHSNKLGMFNSKKQSAR